MLRVFFKKLKKKIVRSWSGVRGPVVRNSDCSSRGLQVGFSASKWWLTVPGDPGRHVTHTYMQEECSYTLNKNKSKFF